MLIQKKLREEKRNFCLNKPANYNKLIFETYKELNFKNYSVLRFIDRDLINFKDSKFIKSLLEIDETKKREKQAFNLSMLISKTNFNSKDITNFLIKEKMLNKFANIFFNINLFPYESEDLKNIVDSKQVKEEETSSIITILKNQKNIDFILDYNLKNDEIEFITYNKKTSLEFNKKYINKYENKLTNLQKQNILSNFKLDIDLIEKLGLDIKEKENKESLLKNPNLTEEIIEKYISKNEYSIINNPIKLSKKFMSKNIEFLPYHIIFSNLNTEIECENFFNKLLIKEFGRKEENSVYNSQKFILEILSKIREVKPTFNYIFFEKILNENSIDLDNGEILRFCNYNEDKEKINEITQKFFIDLEKAKTGNITEIHQKYYNNVIQNLIYYTDIPEKYIIENYKDFNLPTTNKNQVREENYKHLLNYQIIPEDLKQNEKFINSFSRSDILCYIENQIKSPSELEEFKTKNIKLLKDFSITKNEVWGRLFNNFNYLKELDNNKIIFMLNSFFKDSNDEKVKNFLNRNKQNIYSFILKNNNYILEKYAKPKEVKYDFGTSL